MWIRTLAMTIALAGVTSCSGTGECAGGTAVTVVNETSSSLFVAFTPTHAQDASVSTRTIDPGEELQIADDFSIGGSTRGPASVVSHITISDGVTTFYDGAVAAPPFVISGRPEARVCSSATYTFTASPPSP